MLVLAATTAESAKYYLVLPLSSNALVVGSRYWRLMKDVARAGRQFLIQGLLILVKKWTGMQRIDPSIMMRFTGTLLSRKK